MSEADIPEVARMVLKTWEMEAYGKDIAMPSSEVYVASCYYPASSAYVA